jgi:hypothetical protein
MGTPGHSLLTRFAPPVLSLGLLAGLLADKAWYHTPTADSEPYHLQVAQLAAESPVHIDDWVGVDVPIPRAAFALLRPNVILSRRFETVGRGLSATFLLVHCRDARDMEGHYPPRCYPGQGWKQVAAEPMSWRVAGMDIPGTEYEFTTETFSRSGHLFIENFMVLPDGKLAPDIDGVVASAKDYRKKFFGAAQVQVVFDASVPPETRREVFETLVAAHAPLIEKIRTGVAP